MSDTRPLNITHLFTIRMWAEALDADRAEWRGKVQHMASGETRYFRDWPALVAFLREALPPLSDDLTS